MLLRLASLLVPFIALAQAPPEDVDKALRERAAGLLQNHVEGNFRKAFEYVAEDTKDYYFAAQKVQFKSFHIDSIDYSDQFTKAEVRVSVVRDFTFYGHTAPIATVIGFHWVLEGGKWYWHYDPISEASTPMGKSDPRTLRTDPNAGAAPPAHLTPEAINSKALQIVRQSSVDKTEVVFATGKASADQILFHNGYPGAVRVVVDPGPSLAGFHVQLDKPDVAAGGDAVIKLSYQPSEPKPKSSAKVRLTVEPFNQVFEVNVKFTDPAQ
jgi:hypothetical protein